MNSKLPGTEKERCLVKKRAYSVSFFFLACIYICISTGLFFQQFWSVCVYSLSGSLVCFFVLGLVVSRIMTWLRIHPTCSLHEGRSAGKETI